MFRDRIEAGTLLAAQLKKFKNDPSVVLAIPRGGVPVAYAVAKELGFPLDLVFTKKIGHPFNKEYAIGAASLTDYFVEPHPNVPNEYVEEEVKRIRKKLREMYTFFMDDREPESLTGKSVIIIDDGMATGKTILGIIHVIRKSKPAKIIVAVPVASNNAVQILTKEADEVIALMIPEHFHGVGAYYEDFEQVDDAEVLFYLDKWRKYRQAS